MKWLNTALENSIWLWGQQQLFHQVSSWLLECVSDLLRKPLGWEVNRLHELKPLLCFNYQNDHELNEWGPSQKVTSHHQRPPNLPPDPCTTTLVLILRARKLLPFKASRCRTHQTLSHLSPFSRDIYHVNGSDDLDRYRLLPLLHRHVSAHRHLLRISAQTFKQAALWTRVRGVPRSAVPLKSGGEGSQVRSASSPSSRWFFSICSSLHKGSRTAVTYFPTLQLLQISRYSVCWRTPPLAEINLKIGMHGLSLAVTQRL